MSPEVLSLVSQNETLQDENLNLQTQVSCLQEDLAIAKKKIDWFEEQLKLGSHRHYGKRSETAHSLNYSLFDAYDCDEVAVPGETAQQSTEEPTKETLTYTRPKSTGSTRKIDTSTLPKEQVIHDLPESDKVCACGSKMKKIGEDISQKIDYVPASLKVIEHIQPKYACSHCQIIQSAKKPAVFLPKSMATAGLITDVIIKKYDEHLPLYRQSQILARDNVVLPDNTLGNWVMKAAEALAPLWEAACKQIALSSYIQADETRVKILKPDKTGYMWVYQGLDPGNRFILFEFNLTRQGSVPAHRLAGFAGLLQTDGYAGYHQLGQCTDVIHLGCWDHARRKFVEAIKVHADNKTGIAGRCLKLINGLYKIERQIKQASNQTRQQVRLEKAQPILRTLFETVNKVNVLPKSTLSTAITYLKNNQRQLSGYIEHGQAHLSNCLTENAIRPFALGRKNWMFVGNEACANKSALLYSLLSTCKLNKLDIRQYLQFVLNQTHAMRRGQTDPVTLLPQFIDKNLIA